MIMYAGLLSFGMPTQSQEAGYMGRGQCLGFRSYGLQGYLAHKKQRPLRILPQEYA